MSLPIPEELVGTTQALFYEFRHQTTSTIPAPYTLKEYDWEDTVSMYKIYMGYDTEYDAAIALLGSWSHWQKLCKTKWFSEYKTKWDEEKTVRDLALARKTLLQQADDGNVTAAKAILEEEKNKQPKRAVGRQKRFEEPTKDFSDDFEKMASRIRRVK